MNNEFTKRLNAQIEKSGVTQAALSKLTGIPQPQISMKLTGVRRNWTLDQALKICTAIGMNPHLLLAENTVGEQPKKLFGFKSEISAVSRISDQLATVNDLLNEGEPELASKKISQVIAALFKSQIELDERIESFVRLNAALKT